ncbi:hypothetical protein RSAG8_02751, partial [Rhizoctonia solani AG-8 WAC10335]
MTGKFFVLSVMINICGRNLIQEQLSQSAKAQYAQSRNPGGLGTPTMPVMIRKEKTTEYELNEWPITPGSARTETNPERVKSHSLTQKRRKLVMSLWEMCILGKLNNRIMNSV